MKRWLMIVLLIAGSSSALFAEMAVELQVSTSISDRVPVGAGTSFAANVPQLVGWSRVRGASEPIEITHRWRRDGKDVARVKLPIRSSNYRVWSYCEPKGRTGSWTLDVLDWDGNVLASQAFEIK